MLWEIIRKEILETIYSPKFVFTFLLCTILILFSIFIGTNNYRAELREYNAAIALNKKNLESQPSYMALAGIGMKITKPPQVLGTIVTGIQEAVGRQATINVAYDPKLVHSKYNSNPVFATFGGFDLTLVVLMVLSLFAILFTYDAIVGEKERGTLKLTLSNFLPRDKLILGKIIGSYLSLMIPLIIPLLLGIIILVLYPDIHLIREDWIRIGLIFVLFFLYLSVFFTLGLFVSSRTSRSSSSLFILLFIWVIFIAVIPKSTVMLAGQIYPIPSVHEITAQKDAFLQEIQGSAQKEARKWMMENKKRASESQEEFQNRIREYLEDFQQKTTAKIDAKNAEIEREYQAKQRKQQIVAMNLSRISPAALLTFGSMSLGKTGVQEHEHFLNSIKNYKPIFTKWANAKMMKGINFKTGEQAKPDISDMPQYEFKPESLRDSFVRALPDFVIMTLLIILFFIGAFVSFLRYDVR